MAFQLIYWGTPVTATDSLINSNEATKTLNTFASELSDNATPTNADDETITKHNDDSTANLLDRKKRWITTGFCMNYPLCCDVKGKDTCGFYCPVCPIKRDYCKLVIFNIKLISITDAKILIKNLTS